MIFSFVQDLFQDVYAGETSSYEGQNWIHRFCNQKGLNPTVETPISFLLMTKEGQEEIGKYEEFMKAVTWLMAKLSAKVISVEEAKEHFEGVLFQLEQGKKSNICDVLEKRWEKEQMKKRYDAYFSCSSCASYVKNDQNFY